jgi:galactose oxidase-like protein/Kelch motif protein
MICGRSRVGRSELPMRSTTALSGGLALAMLACTSEPTGPDTPGNPSPAAPSFVLASNTWTLKAPMPADWSGASAGVAPDPAGRSIVYAFGGQDDQGGTTFGIRAYDVATNTWTAKAQSTHGTRFNGVGRIGGRLYFSGGFHFHDEGSYSGYQAELYAYDPAGDSLIRKRDMPQYTADGVTGVIGGKLYVLPGICSPETPYPPSCQNSPIRLLYRYDPATDGWTKLAPSPHFHQNGARGVINGKFYVAGGEGVAALDRYDPATNTWKTLAPLPLAGYAYGGVLQGKLYVVVTGPYPTFVRRAYAYDPATNKWTSKAVPKWWHDEIVQVTLDGRPHLLAVGGVHGPYIDGIIPIPNDTELYTP